MKETGTTAKKAKKKKEKITMEKTTVQAISKSPGKVGNLVRRK